MCSTEIPSDARKLHEMLLNTPDVCGCFTLTDDTAIELKMNPDFKISIIFDPREFTIILDKRLFGSRFTPLTHWHVDADDIYEELCNIARRGNVLVIRNAFLYTSVLYRGTQKDCPYPMDRKWNRGRMYFIKAE